MIRFTFITRPGTTVTPFTRPQYVAFLADHGIVPAEDPRRCDVFVREKVFGRKFKLRSLLKYGPGKKYLIWTDEPNFDQTFSSTIPGWLFLPETHVMNVYTGDIFADNYTMFRWARHGPLEPVDERSLPDLKSRRVVGVYCYRMNPEKYALIKDGRNLDLNCLRTRIGLVGHRLGKMDIFGGGWPDGISKESSRHNSDLRSGPGAWHRRKMDILAQYRFNLCFENTNYDYYCTEKIWGSSLFLTEGG